MAGYDIELKLDKDELWAATLEALEASLPDGRPRIAFNRLFPREVTADGRFILAVPNVFNQNWIERSYLELLTTTVNNLAPYELQLEVVVDESIVTGNLTSQRIDVTELESSIETDPVVAVDAADRQVFDPKLTFDNFVIGDSNQFARNAALAVAEQPGLKYNPLFIWGGSGLGKTHLLLSIASYVRENYPHKKVIYTTSADFKDEFVNHTLSNTPEAFRNKYRSVDVLLIDDIQMMEKYEKTVDQFFHTFNHLQQYGKQVVIASDRSPRSINMDERYSSRFNSGLQVDIQPPPFEVRLAILRQYTEHQGIVIEPDALSYIAEKAPANIREMEGVVNRITAWAKLSPQLSRKASVSIDDVKVSAPDLLLTSAHKTISVGSIQKEVCRYYGIAHAELIGGKRKQEIVFPRHIAMYLSQELTDLSLPKIGAEFGGKDHTTVMHAAAKIKKLMATKADVYEEIEYLTKELRKKAL